VKKTNNVFRRAREREWMEEKSCIRLNMIFFIESGKPGIEPAIPIRNIIKGEKCFVNRGYKKNW
jgi:hypothetical protein